MSNRTTAWILTFLLLNFPASSPAADIDPLGVAQALGKARPAASAQPDGLIVCEAEEFQIRSPGWKGKSWGENYYSATFANTFLSRKAFLGAPEQGEKSVAELAVDVPSAGRYLALVRYEAAYRFETQFRVQVEQGGKLVLDRLYGARNNLKIWAFSQKLKAEVRWDWGACENVVWEGHDAFVDLQPGRATIRLIADKQPEPAAKRNVDLVMLTTDVDQVNMRIQKEAYLPLDGMLTQSGDVFVKVHNLGGQPVTVTPQNSSGGVGVQHSPYWVHLRNWPKFVPIEVAAGKSSDWIEFGGQLDSLNDGQFGMAAKGTELNYKLEFGAKSASGTIEAIASFASKETELPLAYQADTRYSRRVRHQEDVLYELLDYLKKQPAYGRAPIRVPIYALTFDALRNNPKHAAAVAEFCNLYSIHSADAKAGPKPPVEGPRDYIDVRSVATDKLADYCAKLADVKSIRVVSLGDEIALPAPNAKTANDDFRAWLQTRGLKPTDVDPAAGNDWAKIVFTIDPKQRESQPGIYYWSARYHRDFGIQNIKQRTDILRKHLPNAMIGANFSPHHGGSSHTYLGEVFQWVTCFRDQGLTLPWAEDYIFQIPVGSQQMNNINLDLFRAGLRGRPHKEIMYYVMPHWPGNNSTSWRRLFYGAIGHGATMINLFEFRPVQAAYTENHVTNNEMYSTVLRGFRELSQLEDIVADGRVRPSDVGLWFSETADIWHDNDGSFAAAKRALYTAIIHQQTPLDFVVEQDALDGTIAQYKVLYLTDAHVTNAASKKIADWVEKGGQLFATAGAGMFDELNRPNATLRQLLGVEPASLEAPAGAQVGFIKEDLPFTEPLDTVTWNPPGASPESLSVLGVRSRVKTTTASTEGTFKDGSTAVATRKVGAGGTTYCGFLPSLSYYKAAIPKRPVDRSSAVDSFTHFIPTQFDKSAAVLIASATKNLPRSIERSEPLVEATVIEAKQGVAIPLVNWSAAPVKSLTIRLNFPAPAKASLASGAAVSMTKDGTATVFTLDLETADVLVLR